MLDEVWSGCGVLDVDGGSNDVEISVDVLLDTSVSDVVVFINVLDVARATDDEVTVLEAKVIALLVVVNAVVAGAEEEEVRGTGVVLLATMED